MSDLLIKKDYQDHLSFLEHESRLRKRGVQKNYRSHT